MSVFTINCFLFEKRVCTILYEMIGISIKTASIKELSADTNHSILVKTEITNDREHYMGILNVSNDLLTLVKEKLEFPSHETNSIIGLELGNLLFSKILDFFPPEYHLKSPIAINTETAQQEIKNIPPLYQRKFLMYYSQCYMDLYFIHLKKSK